MEESSVMLEKKSIKETLVNLDFKAILVLAITENHIRKWAYSGRIHYGLCWPIFRLFRTVRSRCF